MKRTWLFLFVLLLVAVPAAVQAQFTYTTNNDEITLTAYTGSGGAVVVSNFVTSIGDGEDSAFGGTEVTNVTIPTSVTSISGYAFYGCTTLTSIMIGTNVSSIGEAAFFQDSSLTIVAIPGSVTSIGQAAFYECSSLTNLTISNGVSSIGQDAFYGCATLPSVMIGTNVTSIGQDAFADCSSLTSVTIPGSVASFENVFFGCPSLTNVTIDNNVTSIGQETFYGCTILTSVTIPTSVTSIDEYAFYGCTTLASVIIPASVSSIGQEAFYGCNSLTNVIIPASVSTIGSTAFGDCSGLTSVTIPGSVTSFENVFFGSDKITNVAIENSVTSIGQDAFDGCSTLTSITIGTNVSSIGVDAFADCTSLTSVIIPASVTSIGIEAFAYCSGLTSVYFNGNAPTVDSSAFNSDNNATVYYLPATTGWSSSFAGLPAMSEYTSQAQFIYMTNAGAITITGYTGTGGGVFIPPSINGLPVTTIASNAFENVSSLTSVWIPASLTNIGNDAFSGSTNLTSVYFDGNAPTVGFFAFNSDTNATVYYLPATTGWSSPFAGLPAMLEYTSHAQFNYMTNAGAITITGYFGPDSAVAIPPTINGLSVTSIGDDAFDHSTNLTSITIPDSVTSIGVEAFAYCSGLTSVMIPNSVTSIGDRAFKECTIVTNFSFNGNAPAIGDEVFESDYATICYVSGASGWSSPFGGLPASPCNSPTGSLQVTITPAGAISAGAQWQVDTGTSQNSGATVTDLSAGSHTVSFTPVSGSGWLTPANQTVTITYGAATTTSGVYIASTQAQVQWSKRIASTTTLPSGEGDIGMALDSQGNCYVSGLFDGTNDFGGVILTNESIGGSDIFVAKYNSSGVLQWAQRDGDSSTNFDYGRGVGVDTNGNVYVAGGFVGPVEFGGTNLPATQDEEFFLAKYDSEGTVKWVQQSVGGYGVYGTGLAVDGAGNCYALVFGNVQGANITFGSTNLTTPSDYDESTVLVKYDNTGAVKWAQLIGGSGETYATKVAVDAAGNVYVCGSFEVNMTIGSSNLVGSVVGSDMFIAKFENSGALAWVRQTEGGDAGSGGVAVDQAGNVYVASPFEFAINFDGVSLTNAANNAFVAKYSNSGTIQWARQAGGTSFYEDVALDGQGNVYPAGFLSTDATVANYDPAGTLQWTFSASGTPASPISSLVEKCAVDSAGNCYLAGWYQGTATFGTNVLQPKGTWNFFLAKLNAIAPNFGGTTLAGANLVLNGVNGLSGATYCVLMSTNLTLPLSQWTPVATNVLSASGNFTITATNAVTRTVPQRFYILQTQ